MAEVPDDLRYTKTHEWVRVSGPLAVVGITDFAQEELHEAVYIELPEPGMQIKRGAQFAAVESVKARSEIFSPISGKVIRVNNDLTEGAASARPELVNAEPYAGGWLVEIEMSDLSEQDMLLTPEQYRKNIEAKSR